MGGNSFFYEHTIKETYISDQVSMLELCLGLEEWMKKTSYIRAECHNLPDAIAYVLSYVAQTLKKGGLGSLFFKNHLYLHLRDYMQMWGGLRQMNSGGPSESHHKTEVKAPSMNTQRRMAQAVGHLCLAWIIIVRAKSLTSLIRFSVIPF
jgi:hypothetical protein